MRFTIWNFKKKLTRWPKGAETWKRYEKMLGFGDFEPGRMVQSPEFRVDGCRRSILMRIRKA